MAHGVLHRAQQRVRACPQTGPLRAHVPPRSSETAQRRAVRASHGQLAGCCSSSQGHSVLPGQRFEDAAMCMLRCLSGRRLLPTRLADLCLCADAPRAVASVCWPQTGRLLRQPGSRNKSRPSVPAQACREPCTLCRTHSAACHSLPGTQGGQYTALCSGAAVHAALCTAQAALSSTSIPSGTTVSAATTCQDSPR